MLNIFTSLIDLIAPPPESVRLIRNYPPEALVRYFAPELVSGSVALANFHAPAIHATIVANKFHNYPEAATLLARLLDTWLDTLPNKKTCLVPIPLGRDRQRARGYNQVERIISRRTHTECSYANLLIRSRETLPQTSLTRAERLQNMTGVFSITTPLPLSSERIIIVDDVVTTGATLRAAAAAITPHLPPRCELFTVAIAH